MVRFVDIHIHIRMYLRGPTFFEDNLPKSFIQIADNKNVHTDDEHSYS
jgi:hypothetical protein